MQERDFSTSEQSPEDGALTDDALLEIADALFVELDRAENEPQPSV